MTAYTKKIEVRWSDLDPNFHMIHSRYYDIGAYCRTAYLNDHEITPAFMKQHHIGPILFREECVFKREINFGDDVSVNFQVQKMNADGSRWTMLHEIWKNTDTLAAVITCDGAWMDTQLRKLALPPAEVMMLFETAPKAEGFTITTKTTST